MKNLRLWFVALVALVLWGMPVSVLADIDATSVVGPMEGNFNTIAASVLGLIIIGVVLSWARMFRRAR